MPLDVVSTPNQLTSEMRLENERKKNKGHQDHRAWEKREMMPNLVIYR